LTRTAAKVFTSAQRALGNPDTSRDAYYITQTDPRVALDNKFDWDQTSGQWVDKVRQSTFFPADWSQARIEYEVSEAFKARQTLTPTKWSGTSPSGIVIEGFTNPNRTTFYPMGNP
jgi:hypothetical protein